jgi:hypothetical protein
MNDFQSVKQREGAWKFRDQDNHATVRGPAFVGKSRQLTEPQRSAIPLCGSVAALASVTRRIPHLFGGKTSAAM